MDVSELNIHVTLHHSPNLPAVQQPHSYGTMEEFGWFIYVVELLDDWTLDVPSWKYPRNLESPRVSSPGFGNDSMMMVM
ncbi:hypothetical protein TNCV_1267531 [Trichonephila clavipes]|nr:hypothetical protein TNCV_1267531 [Trichonephila clavipes]